MMNFRRKHGRKSIWPIWKKTTKPSAPASTVTLGGNTICDEETEGMRLNPSLRVFSFNELKSATRNFHKSTLVGEAGITTLYKGSIHDDNSTRSIPVAVKKLNRGLIHGFIESLQLEVEILNRHPHPNLEKLLGYGWNGEELFLVYEFMQQGSLKDHLCPRGSVEALAWDIRLKILTEAARCLEFLHSHVNVIYKEFKTSHILLDQSYNVKLSDYGLARIHNKEWCVELHGYEAPEYAGHSSKKSDVYSFGVVLVQVLTGLQVMNGSSHPLNLIPWAMPLLSEKLEEIMDPRLKRRYCCESAAKIAELALSCLQMDPRSRPTMQQVVKTLQTLVISQ